MDFTEEERVLIREKVDKLMSSSFKQQTLAAWRPIPSFRLAMFCFVSFAIVFIGVGILIYSLSTQIQQVIVPYNSDVCHTIGA